MTVSPTKRLPLLVWANGACDLDGAAFSNYLTEVASHGFIVVANGNPKRAWGGTGSGGPGPAPGEKSRASMLTQSIDWAGKGAAGGKYGLVDMSKVGVGGQSCGGVER
jgi:dipeptidyl aminopeptidase/acylaminoacyl peptidase